MGAFNQFISNSKLKPKYRGTLQDLIPTLIVLSRPSWQISFPIKLIQIESPSLRQYAVCSHRIFAFLMGCDRISLFSPTPTIWLNLTLTVQHKIKRRWIVLTHARNNGTKSNNELISFKVSYYHISWLRHACRSVSALKSYIQHTEKLKQQNHTVFYI